MTDTMINSDATPAAAASNSAGTLAPSTPPPTSPVPVTAGVAGPTEVGSSWGLLLVPILICVVLALYISLV